MPVTTPVHPVSTWLLLVWLFITGGLVAVSGEDDEVIEIEPPAPVVHNGPGPVGSP